ncbi:GNAT family N-acetyltransferase [Acetobacter fallax]|uniref:GNAT family N-acetyltransferase n=1 Tax=Acetobacter fallax TaxID=1737473 RepID=UPI00156B1F66|nr:GNAT family N-acetyltransferase [Acetobacter fallax]
MVSVKVGVRGDVRLVPLRPEHAEAMFSGLSDARGYRFLPDDPPGSVEDLREKYVRQSAGAPAGSGEVWRNWLIAGGDGAGLMGYTQATFSGDDAVIGYHVFPAFWRRGVATAAVGLTLDAVFAVGAVKAVRAFADTRNAASVALMERLDFRCLRVIEGADFFRGESSDEYEFTLSRRNWLAFR